MPAADSSVPGASLSSTTAVVEASSPQPWQDPRLGVAERVADLTGRMTLEEKVAQLYGVWVTTAADGESVAPHQHDLASPPQDWDAFLSSGLGQLTRSFGTAPVDPALGARALARTQQQVRASNRFGIPALAHEECLAGFTAWRATIFPVPLSWGASFDPDLVEEMASAIGASMRGVGVHQGLAPVLDVTMDPRWGRTEETAGEDPYLVGRVTSAYVRGLEQAGVVATLKHFVGYSTSKAARNLAPVSVGARELADVLLVPFEMAVREAAPRSVMHSYAAIDGMPVVADPTLLTDLLRTTWGFDGTVVADYFGITFLHTLHGLAEGDADAAHQALAAGVDVELPTARCYSQPLVDAVRAGHIPEALVDRALERVLRQKCELGLLDADWQPVPPVLADALIDVDDETEPERLRGLVDLDPPASRDIARRLAEESVVLLERGVLPLAAGTRVAVVGPLADDPMAMMGCYSFPSHVGNLHAGLELGVEVPTVLQALGVELGTAPAFALGCTVDGTDDSGIAAAVDLAREHDVVVVALGDRAGLFGRGTSGEGCDAADLTLPGLQPALLDALLATGKPVVVVMLSGRPYALGRWSGKLAGLVQAFFPGEEGGPAIAGVLSGRVNPSGRLPVSLPREPGGMPWTYLGAPLAHVGEVSNIDPTPLHAFGAGTSYTTFDWSDACVDVEETGTDGTATASLTVRNTGDRAGTEIVQLYLHDPVASVSRPVVRLIGFARVALEAGQAARVSFGVHADLSSFTGRDGTRIVEPGRLELRLSADAEHPRFALPVRLVGDVRRVDHRRTLHAEVRIEPTA
ncbi:MAG: glycoside hydrolase family 3 N-terminal domain-containing protein [Kineosporiaceae bacterium]